MMERSNIKSVAKTQGMQEQLLIPNYSLLIETAPNRGENRGIDALGRKA